VGHPVPYDLVSVPSWLLIWFHYALNTCPYWFSLPFRQKKVLFSFSASLLPSDLYLRQSSGHWIQWPWLKQVCLIRIPNVYIELFTSFQRTSPNSSVYEVLPNLIRFHGEHSQTTKLEDHSLSAVRSCCSYMEAAFSVRNLQMRHVVAANFCWFVGDCNVHYVN